MNGLVRWIVLIIAIVIVAIIIWVIHTVNKFKRLDIRIEEGRSGIEVALEKRYDLLTQLTNATKAYADHELKVFSKAIELNEDMTVGALNNAQAAINDQQTKVIAVAENYPKLCSSDIYKELMDNISDAEAHLQAARRVYNTEVAEYNTAIAVFPSSLFADGRQPKEFFKADNNKKQNIEVNL